MESRPPITPFRTPQQPTYPARQNNQRAPRPHDRVLGPDGKLKPEEANRRRENNLCLMCGKADHKITACPSATRVRASMLQVDESSGPPMEVEPTDANQENGPATLHVQRR